MSTTETDTEIIQTAPQMYLRMPDRQVVFPNGQIIALPTTRVTSLTYCGEKGFAHMTAGDGHWSLSGIRMTPDEFKAFSDMVLQCQPAEVRPEDVPVPGECPGSDLGCLAFIFVIISAIVALIYFFSRS